MDEGFAFSCISTCSGMAVGLVICYGLCKIYEDKPGNKWRFEAGEFVKQYFVYWFPLIIAYFSEKEIATAIICDQITFCLLSTIGIIVAIRSSQQQKLNAKLVLKRVFTFPPLIGCMLALIIPRFLNLSAFDVLFEKLSGTVGPLALFSIGLQLKFGGWFSEIKHISFALLYKLVFAPLSVLIIAILLGMSGMIAKITIFEMAMPTLLTAGVVADQYNLKPKVSNLVVGIGILLSFITTWLWWLVLNYSGLI